MGRPKKIRKLTQVEHKDNGDVVITSLFETKRVRAADGTWRTMYSADGTTWAMQPRRLRNRLHRAERLHPGYLDKLTAPVRSGSTAREAEPVLLDVKRHGQPLSSERAKTPRKPKNFRDVRLMRPIHHHRCHGKLYPCACDTPWKKKPCGGDRCLQTLNHLNDMVKSINERRIK